MTLTLDDLRAELRAHLGVDSTDLPDASADLLINRSYWEISDKFPFRAKEATSTVSTVVGTRRYAMPAPFEALRFIALEDENGKHFHLERWVRQHYETQYVNDTDTRGQPTNYFREADDFILYPTPDAVFALTVGFWSIFDDLSDSNTTPELPQVWHEIILDGAIWRGWKRLGNYGKMREIRAGQVALINSTTPVEVKEEFDSRMAGIELPEGLTGVDW